MASRHAVLLLVLIGGCSSELETSSGARRADAAADSGFAQVQARGHVAMGVDQYTSTHRFHPLPDGGRIELQRDLVDSAGRQRIRAHMAEVAAAFRAGDFSVPGFVHGREVPGAAGMAAGRAVISYEVESLPNGAAIRVRSDDSAAVAAIHEFLAFQRQDHHAGGHE